MPFKHISGVPFQPSKDSRYHPVHPSNACINLDAYHPDGKPCSSVFDVLQDDNYWNSNEEIIIDEDQTQDDEEGGWTVPERWWRSKRRGMDRRPVV